MKKKIACTKSTIRELSEVEMGGVCGGDGDPYGGGEPRSKQQ